MGGHVYEDMWIWSYQHQEWEEVGLWSKYLLVRYPSLASTKT